MSLKKGVLAGNKVSASHSTIIEGATKIFKIAKERPEFRKVVLGVIEHVGPGPRRIKFKPILAGLQMTVRGNTAKQEFYIYTNHPQLTQSELKKAWTQS
jgi:hypothetical protein